MIAPEGKIILIPLVLVSLCITFIYFFKFSHYNYLKYLIIGCWFFLIFSIYFFREPKRVPIGGENEMVSPADGKIVQIVEIDHPEIGKSIQISIFLSVFNVHSQWVPISGKVLNSEYNKGKFLAAFNDKASLDNEQTSVLFQSYSGERYIVKQIAGLIARRILNYMNVGDEVFKGQRLGFIRFGSRVDIIVPPNFKIFVSLGDKVSANTTIIGKFI